MRQAFGWGAVRRRACARARARPQSRSRRRSARPAAAAPGRPRAVPAERAARWRRPPRSAARRQPAARPRLARRSLSARACSRLPGRSSARPGAQAALPASEWSRCMHRAALYTPCECKQPAAAQHAANGAPCTPCVAAKPRPARPPRHSRAARPLTAASVSARAAAVEPPTAAEMRSKPPAGATARTCVRACTACAYAHRPRPFQATGCFCPPLCRRPCAAGACAPHQAGQRPGARCGCRGRAADERRVHAPLGLLPRVRALVSHRQLTHRRRRAPGGPPRRGRAACRPRRRRRPLRSSHPGSRRGGSCGRCGRRRGGAGALLRGAGRRQGFRLCGGARAGGPAARARRRRVACAARGRARAVQAVPMRAAAPGLPARRAAPAAPRGGAAGCGGSGASGLAGARRRPQRQQVGLQVVAGALARLGAVAVQLEVGHRASGAVQRDRGPIGRARRRLRVHHQTRMIRRIPASTRRQQRAAHPLCHSHASQ